MSPGFANDPHSERGFECPKNLFGVTNYEELSQKERVLAQKRSIELALKPMRGKFDSAHLRTIHKYLFQDVFPWAGQFRVVNISKGSSMFGPALHIASALDDALSKLSRERLLVGLPTDEFATRSAYYLGEINAIHPFREGNGRAQREFIRQMASHAGHRLVWKGFSQTEMVAASILSHTRGDNSQLAAIVQRAIAAGRGE